MYVTSKTFKCPADRTTQYNSYESFYIGRFVDADDPTKILLSCPRHHKNTRTVAAYLSYAVDTGKSLPAAWNGIPAEFGEVYPDGELTFADGTTVTIRSRSAGIHSSFVDNAQQIQTTIYTTDGNAGSLLVNHGNDSKFAVVTPAVIADAQNAYLEVVNTVSGEEQGSGILVSSGKVVVEDRRMDAVGTTLTNGQDMPVISVAVLEEGVPSEPSRKRVPRRPRRSR